MKVTEAMLDAAMKVLPKAGREAVRLALQRAMEANDGAERKASAPRSDNETKGRQ